MKVKVQSTKIARRECGRAGNRTAERKTRGHEGSSGGGTGERKFVCKAKSVRKFVCKGQAVRKFKMQAPRKFMQVAERDNNKYATKIINCIIYIQLKYSYRNKLLVFSSVRFPALQHPLPSGLTLYVSSYQNRFALTVYVNHVQLWWTPQI